MMPRKYQTLLLPILGIVVLLSVLLTRTLGIHFDENTYLAWARDAALGDASSMGKIYGFYLFNYLIYHGLGPLFGSLRPLCVYFIYIGLGSIALAWLVRRLTSGSAQPWCFALLLFVPFTLFNQTQLMTETPMIILISVIVGAFFDLVKTPNMRSHLSILLAGMILVVFKDNGIIPLATLAVVFYPRLKENVWSAIAGAVLGFALNRFMLTVIHAPNFYQKTVTVSLFSGANLLARLASVGAYIWMWTFYLWPPLMAAAAYSFRDIIMSEDLPSRAPSRKLGLEPHAMLLLRLIIGSIAATLLINFISSESFVRYCYPVVWLGLIASAALASRLKPAVLVLIILTYTVPAAALWGHSAGRMAIWPEVISTEAYYSGFTILPGTAVHGWVALSGRNRKDMCILLPTRSSENAWAIRNYFGAISENPRFFNESSLDDFRRCSGPKAVLRRQYQQDPNQCWPDCPATIFSVRNCTLQEMRGWAAHAGILTNRTCLP